jgi:hypothetical protein
VFAPNFFYFFGCSGLQQSFACRAPHALATGTDRPAKAASPLVSDFGGGTKELGIEINLNYSFLQRNKPDDEPQG